MNDTSNLNERDRWLAAEHALGVLDQAGRNGADSRMTQDAAFRRAVEDWDAQLSPLLDEVEDVTPPAAVWGRLEDRLFEPARSEQAAPGAGIWKLMTAFASTLAVACFAVLVYVTGGDFSGEKIRGLEEQVAALEAQGAADAVALESSRSVMDTMLGQLQDAEGTVAATRQDLDDANARYAALEAQRGADTAALNEAQAELQTALGQLQDAQGAVAASRQEIDAANARFAALQADAASTTAELEGARAELAAALDSLQQTATVLAEVRRQVADTRPLVASLTQSGDAPAFVAQYDPLRKALLIRSAVSDTDEKVPELWLIPNEGESKGKALSMGVLDENAPNVLSVTDTFVPLIADGGTLAITMEPVGGAPGGVATGPVIALGTLQSF